MFNYTFICHYDFLHVGTSFLPCNIGLFLYYELVINNIGIKSNRFNQILNNSGFLILKVGVFLCMPSYRIKSSLWAIVRCLITFMFHLINTNRVASFVSCSVEMPTRAQSSC